MINHLRTTAALAALAVAGGVAAVATAAPEPAAKQRMTLTYRSAHGVDDPTTVKARGPVNGVGTLTQRELGGGRYTMELDLPQGTVAMAATEQDGPLVIDREACTATFESTGTWRITGGTGKYEDATGSGTFTSRGDITGARDADGTCLGPKAPPAERIDVLELEGTARR